MLGARGVDVLACDEFGGRWLIDARDELKPEALTIHHAPYGVAPDYSKVDFKNDVVFTWNATAAGVRVTDGDWIKDDREGLTICDATSAAFAMDLPWSKLDVTTFMSSLHELVASCCRQNRLKFLRALMETSA